MARYRELLKVTSRRNDQVNDWFICDRGRFSNTAVNAPDRPRQPLVDGSAVNMDEALDALVERTTEFLELHGSEALAIVGSPRMSLEGNIMAARLKELLGAGTLCYFGNESHAIQTLEAVSLLNADNSASQEDVRQADLIILMGCALLDEAPMMALAVRQAWRTGALVYSVGSDYPNDDVRQVLFERASVASLADVPFSSAKRPVVVCGFRQVELYDIRVISENGAKLAFIMDGPNTFGCALLTQEYGALPLSRAIADKRVKGIIAFEADLPAGLPDDITVIGAADWRPTTLLARAEVVLPSCSWVEQEGIFVNNEGRAQSFKQVMQPGLPIMGLDPAGHPPRAHRHDTPGGDVLPAWRIMSELLVRLGGDRVIIPLNGRWEDLQVLDAEGTGKMLNRPK
jgi:NADH-quinone oxidoreductase subunit G